MSDFDSTIHNLLQQYAPRHFGAPYFDVLARAKRERIDPVEKAVAEGHMVAVDLLTHILQAQTPSRCLQIHHLMKSLVQTLESIELCAVERADDLNGGGQ